MIRLLTTILLLCVAAHAQSWNVSSGAPKGYALTPGGGSVDSVYTRRFRKLGANHRLRLGVTEVEGLPAEEWLATKAGDRETIVEGSGSDFALAGRDGRRLTFSGSLRLRDKTLKSLRTLAAARLDEKSMLVLESALSFSGAEPPTLVKNQARKAMLELISGLKVERADDTPAATESAAPAGRSGQYRNDTVAPFSFDYPAGWYVAHDDAQSPGSLWVVATPEERTAVSTTLAELATALRVTLVGHSPAMLGAQDELARAVAFVTSARTAADGTKFTVVGDTILGGATGRLLRYGNAEVPQLGLLLVGAADTTVLVADFEARGGLTGDLEKVALDILDSMRINVERDRLAHPATSPAPGFRYPANWSLETVPVSDASTALVLGAGETDAVEVVMRSVATTEALDESRLRSVLARVAAEDLELTTRARLAAASLCAAPMGDLVVHALIASGEGSTDVFAIATPDAVHVCFVDLPGGVAGRDYGLALQTLLSWTDGASEPEDSAADFQRRQVLRHRGFDGFDAAGAARRGSAGRLAFEPDGSVRGSMPGPDGSRVVNGRYANKGTGLELYLDGTTIVFARGSDGGWSDSATGRSWFATPDLD